MCVIVTKVGQGHPKFLWCNASIRSTKCQIWTLYITSQRCNGTRDIPNFRGAHRGDFARLYLENGKLYQTISSALAETVRRML